MLIKNKQAMHSAKPFLKWAGGKTQLISEIKTNLPKEVINKPFTYIEPFVGSGAVFFWMIDTFPNLQRAVINDINTDLTNCYQTIRDNVDKLIPKLELFQQEYHQIYLNKEQAKDYYYDKRELFNSRTSNDVIQSALFIFLNKTCFNGLYRVNSKNQFNVPIGRSQSLPKILDYHNLKAVSQVMQKTIILKGDYSHTLEYANENTLFYFDPPYKPLSQTSSFNSYAKDEFDDQEQIRLAEFCRKLDNEKHNWLLSNSDVKGKDPKNNFFDDLYANYTIKRVDARRNINANPNKRGKLKELLIKN